VSACLLLVTLLSFAPNNSPSLDWPQFRGGTGQGHAEGTGLPLTWSESQNIVWKVPIEGLGWSSPVIVQGQLWLTTAADEGKSLRLLSLSPETGKSIHNVEVFRLDDPGSIHRKNSHASPTPLVEKGRVYVHFGGHGTGCVSSDGKVLWKTQDLKYNHRHGPGGSPVLFDDLLILSCDGTDVAFVVALDKQTGEIRWKTPRDGPMAYSTPLVIHAGGRDQVISTGGDQVVSYEPRTGKEIWRCRYDGYSGVPRPVFGHGLVYVCSGYNTPHLFAIRPDGTGDVTDTHVAWSIKAEGAPLNPSPLLVGDELYLVNDRGIATCLDAKTGKRHWQNRLGGDFSASPLFADGRIYYLDENAKTTVIAPGLEFKVLATNSLDGRSLASLAVWGKSIFLRTDTHLYRIEKR
jgi:outer membrane protein assembly factor BamB